MISIMEESFSDCRSRKFLDGSWFVYILRCENNALYTGITKDVPNRFKKHCAGLGAKYTKIYKPVQLIHIEKYESHKEAFQRELKIKALPKVEKEKLNNLLF